MSLKILMPELNMNIRYFILASIAAMVLTGCTDSLKEAYSVKEENISFRPQAVGLETKSDYSIDSTYIIEPKEGQDDSLDLFVETGPIEGSELESKHVTRGYPYDMSDVYDSTFSIKTFGIKYTSGQISSGTVFMDENIYSRTYGSSTWTSDDPDSWPAEGGMVKFAAIFPAYSDSSTLYVNYSNLDYADGIISYDYTVPSEVEKQTDTQVGISEEKADNYAQTVPMTFGHVLTAIRFTVGSSMPSGMKITKIQFNNIYSEGHYTSSSEMSSSDLGTWSSLSGKTSFSYSMSYSTTGSSSGAAILGGTNSTTNFIMIPQTLGDDAELVVTYVSEDDGTEYNKTYSLAGKEWEIGQFVTYRLSASSLVEYVFTVNPESNDSSSLQNISMFDGSGKFNITSYKKVSSGKVGLKVTATFSTDGGETYSDTIPDFFKSVRTSYTMNSSTLKNSGTFSWVKQTYEERTGADMKHVKDLRARSALSGIDLSMVDIYGNSTSRSTANTYVIHQAGTDYHFPCVYGNAIKNGSTNSSSYTSSAEETLTPLSSKYISLLKNFRDYNNDTIAQPWITNVSSSYSAFLLWENVDGLISNVRLVSGSDGYYIYFDTAGQSSMQDGNAVIALADGNGTIVWSWQIWVTGAELETKTFKGSSLLSVSRSFTFLSLPLGFVETKEHFYDQQDIWVKFTQAESEKELTVHLLRPYHYLPTGKASFYQWGRKDPMPSNAGSANNNDYVTDETIYPASGYSFVKNTDTTNATFASYIQNPLTIYSDLDYQETALKTETSIRKYNLWDANMNYPMKSLNGSMPSQSILTTAIDPRSYTGSVVKTVYDPCPAGFTVPVGNAFCFLTAYASKNADYAYTVPYGYSSTFVILQELNGYMFTDYTYADNILILGLNHRGKGGELDYITSIGGRLGGYWTAEPSLPTSSSGDVGLTCGIALTFSGYSSSQQYLIPANTAQNMPYALTVLPQTEEN
jgi:hypothetical protein